MKKSDYPPVQSIYTIDEYQFLVLLNPLNVKFELPFEIISGVTFVKASKEHRDVINDYYQKYNIFHGPHTDLKITDDMYAFANGKTPYPDGTEIEPSIGNGIIPTDPDDFAKNSVKITDCEWEQWIIEIEQNSITNNDYFLLLDALLLSEANLSVGMGFSQFGSLDFYINTERFYLDYPIKLVYKKGVAICKDYRHSLLLEEVENIVKTWEAIKKFDFIKYPIIGKAISEYKDILLLPRNSSLTIIGLFSILELLLTHDSKDDDTSRISWQLRKKIPLINRRLEKPLFFADYFHCDRDVKNETIIERLYRKRSLIAHGNANPMESDKKLEVISKGDEINFLKLLIRRIIKFAMDEPDLIYDLREC